MLHPRSFWQHGGVFVTPLHGSFLQTLPEAPAERPLTLYDVLAWEQPVLEAVPAGPRRRVAARRRPAFERLTRGVRDAATGQG